MDDDGQIKKRKEIRQHHRSYTMSEQQKAC